MEPMNNNLPNLKHMKHYITFFAILLLPALLAAQRVVTFDPERDTIAHRLPNGDIQLSVPSKAVFSALEQGTPYITGVSEIYFRKIGKSNYLIAKGRKKNDEINTVTMAILLAEIKPGSFQTDNLAMSCIGSNGCSECQEPPNCGCSSTLTTGGSCPSGQMSTQPAFAKVTVTVFD